MPARATCQPPAIALRISVVLVCLGRRLTKTTKQAGQTGRWRHRNSTSDLFDHFVDGSDHATSGVEQAQLMYGRWPDLGQRGRVQTRIVGDHLDRVDAGCPQRLEKRLDRFLIDSLSAMPWRRDQANANLL